jgi:hypothetical protein
MLTRFRLAFTERPVATALAETFKQPALILMH